MNNFTVIEKYFIAAIGGAQWLGSQSILRLLKFFGSAQKAWTADESELKESQLNQRAIESFLNFRKEHPDEPERLADYCDRKHFGLCSYVDEDYPPLLKEISSPPAFFYYRGKLHPFVERIGIVGTRHNTEYGQKVALEFAEKLAATGMTVVSGAARGIDTFAHYGALKSGRTVAVLGCGLDCNIPHDREKFFAQISESGVVISEFNPQVTPTAGTLSARNRIIAGLSKGVIVVEAVPKSGSLITSNYAVEYHRNVFAVPGSIYSDKSVGCNLLIRDGAVPVMCATDVLAKLIGSDGHAEKI